MNYYLAQIMLAAGNSDEESAFWAKILVLVILAALAGLGSLIKARVNKFKAQEPGYAGHARSRYAQRRWKGRPLKELKDKYLGVFLRTAEAKANIEEPAGDFITADITNQKKPRDKLAKVRDLAGGMELLERDFLVSIVENTQGDDKNGVMMQKLSFNELVRRERLNTVNSNALKVYVMNEGNLYGQEIQCEAMKELAKRTGPQSG